MIDHSKLHGLNESDALKILAIYGRQFSTEFNYFITNINIYDSSKERYYVGICLPTLSDPLFRLTFRAQRADVEKAGSEYHPADVRTTLHGL